MKRCDNQISQACKSKGRRGFWKLIIFGIFFIFFNINFVLANPASCTIIDSQTLDANFNCSGETLNITSSGSLKTDDYNITTENLWLEGTLDADASFINITNNWTAFGAFACDTSTVMMTGTGTLDYNFYLWVNNLEIAFPTHTTTLNRSDGLIYIVGNLTAKGGNVSANYYSIKIQEGGGVNDNYTLHGYPYPDTFYNFVFSWSSIIPISSLTMGSFSSGLSGVKLGGEVLIRGLFRIWEETDFDSAGYNINVSGETRVYGTGVINITNGSIFILGDSGFFYLEADSTVNVKNSTVKFINLFATNSASYWKAGAKLNFENSNVTTGDGEQWSINVDRHSAGYNFTNCNISYGNNIGAEIIDVQGNTNGGNNTPAHLWRFGPYIRNETISPNQNNSNKNITFYANITSLETIDSVWLTAGFTDSWQTYLVTNHIGNTYNITINLGNFSAGEFVRYKFYANDTIGNEEYGSIQSFQITTDNVTLFYDNFVYPNTMTLQDWSTKRGTPRITNEFLNISGDAIIYMANYTNKSYYNLSASFRRWGSIDVVGYGIIYLLYNNTGDSGMTLLLRQTGGIELVTKENGSWGYRQGVGSLTKDNNWHDINLIVEGNRIRVYFDSNSTPSIDYNSRLEDYLSGTIGFSSYVFETNFDNITLKAIDLLKIVPINTPIINPSKEAKMFFDIYSTYAVSNILINVSDPLGNVFNKTLNPLNCSGIDTNLFCNISFLNDFSGLSTSQIGRYNVNISVSSSEDSEVINTYFEVKEIPEFTFIHMTDNHYGGYGTSKEYDSRLTHFIDDINNNASFLLPDFVIVQGDVTESGTIAQLNASKLYYDNLTIPYYPICGNHDTSNESDLEKGHHWVDIFGTNKLNYTWTSNDYLFIAVDDSALYGSLGSNILSDGHQVWIQGVLDSNPNTPAFLFSEYASAKSRDAGGSAVGWMWDDTVTRAKLESHGGVLGGFYGQAHLNGKTEINNLSYAITASLATWPCEYRYVQVYKDRIEINMFKSSSICARGLSLGSTDSTHNVTTYNYGLESERNFNITIVNKTFSYANDGTRTENSVTLNNLWNFSVDDLDVTFTMPYSGSCTYTASEGTVTNSDTGTGCEVIVTLDLNAYQTKTISVSPIITSTEETTPSGGTTTYSPSSEQLEEGYSKLLRKTQKVQFIINEETYTAVINSVNVINKKVEIEIEGEGILVELSEGSVGKIDLNDDGYYDLQISCKEVRINGYADLEFKEIHEEIPAEEKEEQESPSKVEEIKIKNWMWISGGTILLIVVGIVIRRLLKKSNKL